MPKTDTPPAADTAQDTPLTPPPASASQPITFDKTMPEGNQPLPAPPRGALRPLTDTEAAQIQAQPWWHSIPIGLDAEGQTIYTPGEVNYGPNGGDWPTARFGLPADLTGQKVLDIGCWDGFFAFECERRGATVTGVDVKDVPAFDLAHGLLDSNVTFQKATAYELAEGGLTGFDLVLFYGVLYHLKYPLRAFDEIAQAVRPGGVLLVETAVAQNIGTESVWAFRPGFDNDPKNYWYPNMNGLGDMLRYAGFGQIETVYDMGPRVTVRAVRQAP